MATKVLVIGSTNMDVVIQTRQFPEVGETLIAEQVKLFPGGKGANQAVAASRLGAEVIFLGAVGGDEHGQYLDQLLADENIDLTYLQRLSNIRTGTAYITTDGEQNQIIVNPAANQYISRDYIKKHQDVIKSADIILLQLEIPLATVWYVVELAHRYERPVILNPAPAAPIPPESLEKITLITPNEHEIFTLLGDKAPSNAPQDVFAVLKERLLMTCGEKGVHYYHQGKIQSRPAYSVPVVDTTGAGDVFNGALAAFWFEDFSRKLDLAVAASALSVTKLGAQSASPTLAEVQDFLAAQEKNARAL